MLGLDANSISDQTIFFLTIGPKFCITDEKNRECYFWPPLNSVYSAKQTVYVVYKKLLTATTTITHRRNFCLLQPLDFELYSYHPTNFDLLEYSSIIVQNFSYLLCY